ncbi:hypothetical protein [Lentzea sp. NEAU-D7]|uniref:hypothetical protein n=1 Tax=Lentzea sp. NEAU-D7 TaxID=2994667 RepID=UPI00224ABFE0|nr:hypothetical protein [Lentzea sp. NEAU-D7]MCX2953786.1 hypothetical protein [Lentzea sp. NEAU-D7]
MSADLVSMRAGEVMVWDATGLLLFLLWLLLPPLYVAAFGRLYVRRCSEMSQRIGAVRDELLDLVDELEAASERQEPSEQVAPVVPAARDDDTHEFRAITSAAGRHRLNESALAAHGSAHQR